MAVYSHSRLETFRKCTRQFYYKYVANGPIRIHWGAIEDIRTDMLAR